MAGSTLIISGVILYIGLVAIPRPPFPDYNQVTALCTGCPKPFLDLYFEGLVSIYNGLTIVPRTLTQAAIGVLGGMSATLLFLRSARQTANLPTKPDRGLARWARLTGVAATIGGLLGFAILGLSGLYFDYTGNSHSLAYRVILFSNSIFGMHVGFSIMATLLLVIGTLGTTLISQERRGFLSGFGRAAALVAAPSAFLFTFGIRLFDDKEMTIHATNFLGWASINHTDLISNWSVLTASAILLGAGVLDILKSRNVVDSKTLWIIAEVLLLVGATTVGYAMFSQ